MNRLVLTLLALLTGLAAQVSPAMAGSRGGGDTEIGLSETQLARQVEAAASVVMTRAVAVRSSAAVVEPAPFARIMLPKPGVLIGIDRARE